MAAEESNEPELAIQLLQTVIDPRHFQEFPATYQLGFPDQSTHDVHFNVADGELFMHLGVSPAAAITLRLGWGNFQRLVAGDLDVHDLLRSGTSTSVLAGLAIEGDVALALPLLRSLRAVKATAKVVLGAQEMDDICRRAADLRTPIQIERRSGVSQEELMESYARASRPLILTDLMGEWPVSRMTLPALREKVGDVPIEVFITGTTKKVIMPIAEYIDSLQMDTLEKVAGIPQYAQMEIPAEVARRLELLPPPYYQREEYVLPRLWLGPSGAVTYLHYDDVDNFLAQVFGEKLVTLYRPDEFDLFAPQRLKGVLGFDPRNIDRSRFPLARHANPVEFILKPGEVLFIPACWYHHVVIQSPSLSVNFFLGRRLPAILLHT